eukprot:m.479478 g.479478  ORF g.479478 m.479478 type:complete len:275 (-) comp21462_c0_seq1:158-982(-)
MHVRCSSGGETQIVQFEHSFFTVLVLVDPLGWGVERHNNNNADTAQQCATSISMSEPTFIQRKWCTLFAAHDFDRNYEVTKADFDAITGAFAEPRDPNEQVDASVKQMDAIWEEIWSPLANSDGVVTLDRWLEACRAVTEGQGAEVDKFKAIFHEDHIGAWFDVIDTDDDGSITSDEFASFLMCWNIPKGRHTDAFKAMDIDGDGQLTRWEFVINCKEYLFNDEEDSPSRHFWGPLLTMEEASDMIQNAKKVSKKKKKPKSSAGEKKKGGCTIL